MKLSKNVQRSLSNLLRKQYLLLRPLAWWRICRFAASRVRFPAGVNIRQCALLDSKRMSSPMNAASMMSWKRTVWLFFLPLRKELEARYYSALDKARSISINRRIKRRTPVLVTVVLARWKISLIRANLAEWFGQLTNYLHTTKASSCSVRRLPRTRIRYSAITVSMRSAKPLKDRPKDCHRILISRKESFQVKWTTTVSRSMKILFTNAAPNDSPSYSTSKSNNRSIEVKVSLPMKEKMMMRMSKDSSPAASM